jgi:hypothetical protein
MTSSPSPSRHLDLRSVLDYLDHTLPAAGRREVEDHLGRPCSDCRERVREVGELLETMHHDRTGEVPAWLHERALAVFEPREQVARARQILEALAELVFDSLATPLPAATRSSVGEARRLRYRLAGHALDLELEREGASTQSLRGRIEAADPALWTVEVIASGERFVALPESGGEFALGGVPASTLEVVVTGPAGRFRLPGIEP